MNTTTIHQYCLACGKDIAGFQPYQGYCSSRCFTGGEQDELPPGRKSWLHPGAFMLTPLWLLFHDRVGTALALMAGSLLTYFMSVGVATSLAEAVGEPSVALTLFLSFEFIFFVVYLAVAFYFGRNGYEIAARQIGMGFDSMEDVVRAERGWEIAGRLFLWSPALLVLFLFLLGMVGVLVG